MILDDVMGRLPAWFADAACLGMPSVRFFGDDSSSLDVAAAREVCAGCRVVDACYEFAVAEGFRDGVWGGVNMGSTQARRDAA